MTEKTHKTAWFGPKRVGFGVQPTSWQGWLLTAAFAGLMVAFQSLPSIPLDRKAIGCFILITGYAAVVMLSYSPGDNEPAD